MTIFIRKAPVQDNTASDWVRTVAAPFGCKILRLILIKCTMRIRYPIIGLIFIKTEHFSLFLLVLKYILFRLSKKTSSGISTVLLCCMNWYSWGIIRSSLRIHTYTVVKFYNHALRLSYGYISIQYFLRSVLLE